MLLLGFYSMSGLLLKWRLAITSGTLAAATIGFSSTVIAPNGAPERFFEFPAALRCTVTDVIVDDSGGMSQLPVFGWDVGNRDCYFIRCQVNQTTTTQATDAGFIMESPEGGGVYNCRASGAKLHGIWILDGFGTTVRESFATGNQQGICLGSEIASGDGCVACHILLSEANQNDGTGIEISRSAAQCTVGQTACKNNGTDGIQFLSSCVDTMLSDVDLINNARYQFGQSDATASGTKSKNLVIDLSVAGTYGIYTVSDLSVTGLRVAAGSGATCAVYANGVNKILDLADFSITCATTAPAFHQGAAMTSRLKRGTLTGGNGIYLNQIDVGLVTWEEVAMNGGNSSGFIWVFLGGSGQILPGCSIIGAANWQHNTYGTGGGFITSLVQTGGAVSVTAGGAKALTLAECYATTVVFTSGVGSDATVTVPSIPGLRFIVDNAASSYSAIIKSQSATTITVATGKRAIVAIDASGTMTRVTVDT